MAESAASGAATFLFTDVEGSTRLLKRLRGRYGEVLAEHQRLLREAFATHGGQEVDTQGDAFFVAFPRAKDAVLAAVDAQRDLAAHAWPDDVDVRVRIGIHTGEAAVAENRYVGLSVHRAARICAVARGGQILISQTTRSVLEDAEEPLPGLELRELGVRALKDLERPVLLTEVVVAERRDPRAVAVDERVAVQRTVLPGPLSLESPFPFVGRAGELERLRSLLPGAGAHGRRVALLSGDAGSGKTRLARELAQEAAANGILVLYGASDAVVTTPYEPFVESLHFLRRVLDPEELERSLGPGAELARLVPELADRLGPVGAPASDPDTERHRLHTSVDDLLTHVSRRRPLVLVLDDVHWVDTSSLHLLRYLARASGDDGDMLVLATFREHEPELRSEFGDALADLVRIEGVTRVQLDPLSRDDVAEFVRRSGGVGRTVELDVLGQELGELTGGNAFLLCETWRSLVETGSVDLSGGGVRLTRPLAELGSPDSVRHVVQSRLARLSPDTTALLELAAVIGAEFELGVLREAAGLPESAVVPALDEAVRSATIEEVVGASLAHRFTHELVRRALVDRLTGARRAELHLRVGEALESVYAEDPNRVVSALAHHFRLAAPVGGRERAVDYNLRAADAAMASFAFEEAVARLSTALELGIADEGERMRVYFRLGAAHHKAGQAMDALEAFRATADLARRRADGDAFALAAIGFEASCWRPAIVDQGAVELAREALATLDEDDSPLRARLLGALSHGLAFAGVHGEASTVRTEAIEMARRVGDAATLAQLLSQAFPALATIPPDDVLAMLTEGRALASRLGDTEVECRAISGSIITLVTMCDLNAARRELEAHREIAERTREPFNQYFAHQIASAIALCDGRLEDAERMAEQSLEWTRHLSGRVEPAVHGLQMFGIRREQGRLDELEPLVRVVLEHDQGGEWIWRPGLVALLVELGMEDEARAELEELRADGFAGVVRAFSTASLAFVTDACAAIEDAESARYAYDALRPLAGGNVQIGQLAACYGSADRYLGMLASTLGEWDQAEAHFEYALYLNRRMAAHTWTARTGYEYARMLLRRDAPNDRHHAAKLLADSSAAAERYGLKGLSEKIRALDIRSPELPDDLSAREVEVLRLVARGHTNREIGKQLVISEHTAANHVRSILRKTGCGNRTDAASYANRHGLVGKAF